MTPKGPHSYSSLNVNLPVTESITRSLALRLQQSEKLLLVSQAKSDAAESLVETLAIHIESREKRVRPRGPGQRVQLRDALAAVLGDALKAHLRRGEMVSRSRSRNEYNGHVGFTAALFTLDQLVAMDLLQHHAGGRYDARTFGKAAEWTGFVSRYEVTDKLVVLAASHGITARTIKADFTTRFPVKAETITKPIELRRFKEDGSASIAVPRTNIAHRELSADVKLANKVLAAATWENCQPPALRRAFRGDLKHGGRWLVAGDAPIQQMAPEDRLQIRINDNPVCEVDVRASQLSIVAALSGFTELLEDPYQMGQLAAYDRAIVKDCATMTLGTGRLRTEWPDGVEHDVSMREITAALVTEHPYMADLSKLLGVPWQKAALRLHNIEADCLTAAMRTLWSERIPFCPIHDSLLVQARHIQAAAGALQDAYRTTTGAIIQTKVTCTE